MTSPSTLSAVDYDPFADAPLQQVVPTTWAQREIWLACQLGTEASLAYNESVTLTFTGPLDVARLDAALEHLLDRHDALRAVVAADGQSLFIAPSGTATLQRVDLPPGAADGPERVRALEAEAVRTPFDLQHGPLWRTTLVRISPDAHALILCGHHIVLDGWSIGVLVHELVQAYRDPAAAARAPAAARFADHALQQTDAAADADERYWLERLQPLPPVIDLPADRLRPNPRTFASRRLDVEMPRAGADALRAASARAGVSLFSTLWGLYAAWMARLTALDTVVVGLPSAGQAAEGLPDLVGHCVHLLPVRVDVSLSQPARDYLPGVQSTVLDAQDHRQLTLGRLLSKMKLERDPSRVPLTPIQFNLDARIPAQDLQLPGLAVALRSNPRAFENFELFVNATPHEDGLTLEAQYNTDLFDAATIEGWLRGYLGVLERFTARPEAPLGELLRPSAAEQGRLAAIQRGPVRVPPPGRLETRIAEQARRRPDALAGADASGTLTYASLIEHAHGLAHRLAALGVRPGDVVGLSCQRTRHWLWSLVGILESGAGYLPLDPALPAERLAFIAADARVSVLVTDAETRAQWAGHTGPVVVLDEVVPSPRGPEVQGLSDTDAAYLIYTSGSTGQPKGVAISHRSAMNMVASLHADPGYTADDRCIAHSTIAFDASILETLPALCAGAEVFVATRADAMDGDAMARLLDQRAITVAFFTPAGWSLVLESGWRPRPGMKLLTGAEALPRELALRLLASGASLWNLYGPTETTVLCTQWRVTADALREQGVGIGSPIANTEIHILDDALQPVPLGAPGELCVAGACVGLGYLNPADPSAARFVDAPTVAGGRLYRTGDLARWRTDGTLVYLGRADRQVKLRGYRIELGEIESVLSRHPAVQQCAVLAREDQPGDPRLVAYVVPAAGPTPDAAELEALLRSHLKAHLPDYMVAQRVVPVPRIPLTPSGKIDAAALPAPGSDPRPTHGARTAPRNDIERTVLATMEGVLKLPGIDLHEDFFSLGGHSLLAARLTAELNRAFALSLPMSAVFQAPTAAALAERITRLQALASRPARPPLVASPDPAPAPATVMQTRVAFIEQLIPGSVIHSGPSAHRLRGPLDIPRFNEALQTIVERQSALRTVVVPDGHGGFVQEVHAGVQVDIPLVDLTAVPTEAREAELMRRMQLEIDRPIELDRAPLLRTALYRLGPEEHVFLFIAHHLVWDGWSFDLLYDEMAAIYGALASGRPHGLPPLSIQYGDFARWHGQWLESEDCAAQLEFWRQRYRRLTPGVMPRTDRPRSGRMTGTGATLWIHVDAADTEGLRTLARQADVTLSMLCMALFAGVMARAVGQDQVTLGMPVRGRLEPTLEPIMGFFTNLVPVHVGVPLERPLAEMLSGLKAQLVDVFGHADVPFERLSQEPEIAAHIQRAGLYQALFSFQDARERRRDWGPLRHENILVKQSAATQDLGLWLMDAPGGLTGGLMYNADLYDAATAERIRAAFLEAVRRVRAGPGQHLSALLSTLDPAVVGALAPQAEPSSTPTASPAPAPAATPRAVAPRTPTEQALAEIWSELLGLPAPDIRPDDNFLNLGGSSLLVMHAIESASQRLGKRVPPSAYLLESLAQLAATYDATAAAPSAPAAADNGARRPGLLSRFFKR